MKKNILNGRFLIVLLAFAIFTFCSVSTYAQPKYGINSITTVTPPYPITLDGFVAEGGTKISLQILPTDITLSQYPVLLKLIIKGNGITIESKSLTIHEPVYLNGNEFLTLNGSDLQAFFNPDNLNFSGYSKTQYQRNGRLPEGVYTVGFELYDVIRKIPVSSVRSTIVFLFLNEVPALTLPMNEQMISAAGTQTVNFRWTTRHSPLAATFFTPEYLFELWEITPAGRNPYDVAKGTRPLYATTLSSPYLAYGIAEPQLQPGKSYAWRVRESDPENRTLFKNNGYTEVYTFTYGRNCPAPELSADKVGTSHLSVNWKADINEKEFELRYREKKKKDAEWYSQSTNLLSGKVDNLKQNTVYEVEVCAVCGDQRSEYSNRLEINTRQNTSFKCGQIDSSRIPQNKNPLRKLSSGDIFNAYGFDVQVKEVTGGTGTFTGKGYVLVPVLNFIKVEVKFDNIQLNEEYQLIGGEVRSVYNLKNSPDKKFEGKDDILDDLTKLITGDEEKNKFDDMADKTIEVDSVKEIKLENGKVVITDVNGKTEEVSTTSNKIIAVKTEEGKEYVVDTSSGTIYSSGNSGQKASVGSPSGPVTTASQAGKGNTPKYAVSFLPHQLQECGFDYPSGKSPAANYEQVEITGKPTLVPWKSTQAGRIERMIAEIAGGPADSVRYYRESNNVVMTAPGIKANQQQIMLNGLIRNEEDKLYAWYAAYNQGDTNKTYARVLAGQLNTVSYEKKAIKVVLVPVNNSSCPRADYVQSELNKIYKSAVVEWIVLNGENITVPLAGGANAVFDNTDKDANMNYTPDMKAAINVFSSNPQYNRETYYLFFLDNAKDQSIKGYMPMKGQFGFIFKYNQYPDEYLRTIAHELGHGPFRLYHTFSDKNKYPQPEGATDNLMDYAAASATNLNKYQWDWVHDPEWRVYWGEEEGEGESELRVFQIELTKVVDLAEFSLGDKIKCITPGGSIIELPSNAKLHFTGQYKVAAEINKELFKGCLLGFETDAKYAARMSLNTTTKSWDFAGYVKVGTDIFYPGTTGDEYLTNVIIGKEDESCNVTLFAGDYNGKPYSGNFKQPYVKDANTLITNSKEIGSYVVGCFGKHARKFYDAHRSAHPAYQESLLRIASLINSVEEKGENVFADYEKYCIKKGSIRYYGNPDLWGTPEDYQLFEKALEAYINKKEVLEQLILDCDKEKRDKLTDLTWLLVDKYSESISYNVRLHIIQILSTGSMYGNSLFGNGQEYLAIRLIETMPKGERTQFLSDIKKGTLLADLYSRIDDEYGGDYFTRFIMALSQFAMENPNKTFDGTKTFVWDKSYIRRDDKHLFAFESNQDISITSFKYQCETPRYYSGTVPNNPCKWVQAGKVTVDPFAFVPVKYARGQDYLPDLGVGSSNIAAVPAIYLHAITTKRWTAAKETGANVAITGLSFCIGIGELNASFQAIRGGVNVVKGLRLLVAVVDVGVTAGDLTIIFAEDKIKSLEGGPAFIDKWNTYSAFVGLLTFSADNLLNQTTDVAVSFTNEYRNLQKTFKDNPAKLAEAIGEANLQKVDKLVDDLERAISDAGEKAKIFRDDEIDGLYKKLIANADASGLLALIDDFKANPSKYDNLLESSEDILSQADIAKQNKLFDVENTLDLSKRKDLDVKYQNAKKEIGPTKNLSLDRKIGKSILQNATKDDLVAKLDELRAENIRVNQTQVNAAGEAVGINRPDIQFTYKGERYYVEIDAPPADRAIPHKDRIILNDANAASNALPDELANLELEVIIDGKITKFKLQGKVTLWTIQ